MQQHVNDIVQTIVTIVSTYGLSILGAIVILIVGWKVAGWAARAVDRAMQRATKIETMLRQFFASLVRYAILVFTGIAVLNQVGIQTASLIAVMGALGLAVGLALQGTLGHVAAGVMLLLFRPFKVGDEIEAGGLQGIVQEVGLFTTELITADKVQIIVPNGQVWDKPIKNFTRYRSAP